MAKISKEEKEAIATHGPPMKCPECGHDVFRVSHEVDEDVKLLWDGDDFVPHVVNFNNGDYPHSVMCRKCEKDYDYHGLVEMMEDEDAA